MSTSSARSVVVDHLTERCLWRNSAPPLPSPPTISAAFGGAAADGRAMVQRMKEVPLWSTTTSAAESQSLAGEEMAYLHVAQTLHGHEGCVNYLGWAGGGGEVFLVSGSDDKRIGLWSDNGGDFSASGGGFQSVGFLRTAHTHNIFCVQQHPLAPASLYSCGADGAICMTDVEGSGDDVSSVVVEPGVIPQSTPYGIPVEMLTRVGGPKNEILFADYDRHSLVFTSACGRLMSYDTRQRAGGGGGGSSNINLLHDVVASSNCGGNEFEVGNSDDLQSSMKMFGITKVPFRPFDLVFGCGDGTTRRIDVRMILQPPASSNATRRGSHHRRHGRGYGVGIVCFDKRNRTTTGSGGLSSAFMSREELLEERRKFVRVSGVAAHKDGKLIASMLMAEQEDASVVIHELPVIGRTEEAAVAQITLPAIQNNATFLKQPRFFGPNDEYLCHGSDHGVAMFLDWPSYAQRQKESRHRVYDINPRLYRGTAVQVDERVCNVVSPHPHLSAAPASVASSAAVFACSGIDKSIKIVARDPLRKVQSCLDRQIQAVQVTHTTMSLHHIFGEKEVSQIQQDESERIPEREARSIGVLKPTDALVAAKERGNVLLTKEKRYLSAFEVYYDAVMRAALHFDEYSSKQPRRAELLAKIDSQLEASQPESTVKIRERGRAEYLKEISSRKLRATTSNDRPSDAVDSMYEEVSKADLPVLLSLCLNGSLAAIKAGLAGDVGPKALELCDIAVAIGKENPRAWYRRAVVINDSLHQKHHQQQQRVLTSSLSASGGDMLREAYRSVTRAHELTGGADGAVVALLQALQPLVARQREKEKKMYGKLFSA